MSIEIFYHFINVILCPMLGRFVEGSIESIRTWCCAAPHISDNNMDLIDIKSRVGIPKHAIIVNRLFFLYVPADLVTISTRLSG